MNRTIWLIGAALLLYSQTAATGYNEFELEEGQVIKVECAESWNQKHCNLLRYSPKGKRLFIKLDVVDDDRDGQFWAFISPDRKILFISSNRLIAFRTDDFAKLWEVDDPRRHDLPAGYLNPNTTHLFLEDGHTLVFGSESNKVYFFDYLSRQWIRIIQKPGSTDASSGNATTTLALSPDKSTLAIGTSGGGIRLHNLEDDTEYQLYGHCGRERFAHHGSLTKIVWLNNSILLTSANDETVRKWNLKNKEPELCFHMDGGSGLQMLIPGKLAIISNFNSAILFDVKNFRKKAFLGYFDSWVTDFWILQQEIKTEDGELERTWDLFTGKEKMDNMPVLVSRSQGQAKVEVLKNMWVRLTDSVGHQKLLGQVVPPSSSEDGIREPKWNIRFSGQSFTIETSGYIHVMIIEGWDFTDSYTWDMTGKLLSCSCWGRDPTDKAEVKIPACQKQLGNFSPWQQR